MEAKKFYGDRLRSARIYRGLTLTELAKQTGISKQSLSLYENDNNTPPLENVLSLATHLDFPMDFFWQKDFCRTNTDTTYFRSQATANKKDRLAQKEKLEYVIKIYEVLTQYIDFRDINLPSIPFVGSTDPLDDDSFSVMQEIEQIADTVRNYWNLGRGPIENLQYKLEENGLIVTGFTLNESKIDAFSQRIFSNDNCNIFVIALGLGSKPQERLNLDMAHELGHILLHPWGENLDVLSKTEFNGREKQANMFASALLLPKDTFGNEIAMYPTDLDYYKHLKKKWHMSIQAMIYRTQQLSIITPNQYTYLMKQVSKNGWRTKEPGDSPGSLNETIFQGAIDILFENNYFDAASFMKELKKYGITLHSTDIEDLLQLRKGTLKVEPKLEDKKVVPIVQLRK